MQQMAPFFDSTPLMGDRDALRERLDCDGYLFVKGLLPRKDVIRVQRRLLQKASKGGWLDPRIPFEAGIANNKAACKDPEDAYMEDLYEFSRRFPGDCNLLFHLSNPNPALSKPVTVLAHNIKVSTDRNFVKQLRDKYGKENIWVE